MKTIWVEAQEDDGSDFEVVAQGFRNVDAAIQHAESLSESYHAVVVHYNPVADDPDRETTRSAEPKGP